VIPTRGEKISATEAFGPQATVDRTCPKQHNESGFETPLAGSPFLYTLASNGRLKRLPEA